MPSFHTMPLYGNGYPQRSARYQQLARVAGLLRQFWNEFYSKEEAGMVMVYGTRMSHNND
jgi:hypothetical protein